MDNMLIYAVFALVGLILLVWLKMYYVRFMEIKRTGLLLDDLRSDNIKNLSPKLIFSEDNFRNLFELPILFMY